MNPAPSRGGGGVKLAYKSWRPIFRIGKMKVYHEVNLTGTKMCGEVFQTKSARTNGGGRLTMEGHLHRG